MTTRFISQDRETPGRLGGLELSAADPYFETGDSSSLKEDRSLVFLRNCPKEKEQQGFCSPRAQLGSRVPVSNALHTTMNRKMCVME